MDLNQMRVFFLVAQAGSFTRAQRALGVQQPAISKAIKALEGSLGTELLERSRVGAALTPAGERLFASCRTIFDEVERAKEALATDRQDLHGDLRVATNEHGASYILPDVIVACRERHKRLSPRIVTGASHLLAREILDGRCELGLFFFLERSAALDRRELAKIPCQLVVAKGRAEDPHVNEVFIGSREIDDVSNKSYPTLKMLQSVRPRTEIKVSCNSLEAHKAMVIRGVGISILPLFMVERELREGTLEILHPEYSYMASVELVTKPGKILSKRAKVFVQLVKAALK